MVPFLRFIYVENPSVDPVSCRQFMENYPKVLQTLRKDERAVFLLRQQFLLRYLFDTAPSAPASTELLNLHEWLKEQGDLMAAVVTDERDPDVQTRAGEILSIFRELRQASASRIHPSDIIAYMTGYDNIPGKVPAYVIKPYLHWHNAATDEIDDPREYATASFLLPGVSVYPRIWWMCIKRMSEGSYRPMVPEENDFETGFYAYLASFRGSWTQYADVVEATARYAVNFEYPMWCEFVHNFLEAPARYTDKRYTPLLEREYDIATPFMRDFVRLLDMHGILTEMQDTEDIQHLTQLLLATGVSNDYVTELIKTGGTTRSDSDNNMSSEAGSGRSLSAPYAMNMQSLSRARDTAQHFSSAERVLAIVQGRPDIESSVEQDEEEVPDLGEEDENGEQDKGQDSGGDQDKHTQAQSIADILGFKFELDEEDPNLDDWMFRRMVEQKIDSLLNDEDNNKLSTDQKTALRYFKVYWLYLVKMDTIRKVLETILETKIEEL